jgi:hypothetical protein
VSRDGSLPITPTADPEDWPYPPDEFVRAADLVEDGDRE